MADKIKNSNGTKAKNDNSKNSAQRTTKNNGQQESPRVKVSTRSANYKEISAIILLMICAFLVVCITGHAGIVGNGVQSVLFGFFGLFGTIMILITMVVLAITVLRGTRSAVFTPKTTVVIIFFIPRDGFAYQHDGRRICRCHFDNACLQHHCLVSI